MTDQQDLRARLPELPEPKRFFGHSTNMPMYTSEEMKDYALEAAAQLGRVDLEEAARYGWEHKSWDWESVRIGIGERFSATPQLPAGVPSQEQLIEWAIGWRASDTREGLSGEADMIERITYAIRSGMLAATPHPDSAAPGGDVLLLQLADTWDALAEKFYARGGDISRAEAAVMRNDAKELRALLKFILANSNDLRADFTKILPGDVLDDSTYQNIEDALDRLESPMQENGRWLKLHERIAALSAPKQVGASLDMEVMEELERAVTKFPTWPTDPIHAVAVLNEEVGELNKALLQSVYEPNKVADGDVRSEAVQVAAMAVRFLLSLPVYRYAKSEQHQQTITGEA